MRDDATVARGNLLVPRLGPGGRTGRSREAGSATKIATILTIAALGAETNSWIEYPDRAGRFEGRSRRGITAPPCASNLQEEIGLRTASSAILDWGIVLIVRECGP